MNDLAGARAARGRLGRLDGRERGVVRLVGRNLVCTSVSVSDGREEEREEQDAQPRKTKKPMRARRSEMPSGMLQDGTSVSVALAESEREA